MIISDILKDSHPPPFMQPTTLNPNTHCTTCGELLSPYGHCWQHQYPPMDPTPITLIKLTHMNGLSC
jgi:hypothetical protein